MATIMTNKAGDAESPPSQSASTSGNTAPSGVPFWVDFVKVFGLLCVMIGAGCFPFLFRKLSTVSMLDLSVLILCDAVSRVGPPMFFIVAGHEYLPSYKAPGGRFYRQHLPTVLLPLFGWTVLYFVAQTVFKGPTVLLHLSKSWNTFLNSFFLVHLWYFYALCWLLLATPLLSVCTNMGHLKVLMLSVALWFCADPLTATATQFWDLHTPFMFQIQGFRGGWTGYYVLGGFLYRIAHVSQKWLTIMLVALCTTLAVVFFGTLDLTLGAGHKLQSDYTLVTGAPVVLLAIPLFFLVRAFGESDLVASSPRLCKFVRVLAEHTYGMYMLHVFFLWSINFKLAPMFAIPANAITMTLVTFLISALLKKIPVLRYLVFGRASS